ncbi:MAG: septum formation initiator family protein [Angelakisella sp.]
MKLQKKEKKRSSLDTLIQVMTIVLFAILVGFFIKTQTGVDIMEEKLSEVTEQVEHQRLVNKDLELTLRDNEEFLERTAREKLEYAHPEEKVFVDASGVK